MAGPDLVLLEASSMSVPDVSLRQQPSFNAMVEIIVTNTMRNVRWLPCLACVVLSMAMFVSYVWAVALGYVSPVFPYISATGARPPVSCYFSLMLNLSALLLGLLVYTRHRQVLRCCQVSEETAAWKTRLSKVSNYSTITGVFAAIGLCFVGNFQSINVPLYHCVGAALAFGVGTVYMGSQCWVTHELPNLAPSWIFAVRMVCTTLSIASMLGMAVTNGVYNAANTGVLFQRPPGDIYHNAFEGEKLRSFLTGSAACEWVVAICIAAYTLTYAAEFGNIKLKEVVFDFEFPP